MAEDMVNLTIKWHKIFQVSKKFKFNFIGTNYTIH